MFRCIREQTKMVSIQELTLSVIWQSMDREVTTQNIMWPEVKQRYKQMDFWYDRYRSMIWRLVRSANDIFVILYSTDSSVSWHEPDTFQNDDDVRFLLY